MDCSYVAAFFRQNNWTSKRHYKALDAEFEINACPRQTKIASGKLFSDFAWDFLASLNKIQRIIIATEICIAPFSKVNQIKGALQKVEKAVYQNQSSLLKKQQKLIYSEYFIFSFYLPKPYRRATNPHPGNQRQKRNENRLQKTPTRKQAREYRWRK